MNTVTLSFLGSDHLVQALVVPSRAGLSVLRLRGLTASGCDYALCLSIDDELALVERVTEHWQLFGCDRDLGAPTSHAPANGSPKPVCSQSKGIQAHDGYQTTCEACQTPLFAQDSRRAYALCDLCCDTVDRRTNGGSQV